MLRWIMGGLDHQIENHLVSRLPHTIYPLLARRLWQLCAEQDITYRLQPKSPGGGARPRSLAQAAEPAGSAGPGMASQTSSSETISRLFVPTSLSADLRADASCPSWAKVTSTVWKPLCCWAVAASV